MRYSKGFKTSILKKILPPANRSVKSVAKEAGLSENTIYNWLKCAQNGKLDSDNSELRPHDRSLKEKLKLLLEGRGKSTDELGKWLRENGLHTEHLTLYEQEIRDIVTDRNEKYKEENKKLLREKKALEKELRRKEKALAEMAALLTLKKKAEEIWGEPGDD